MRALRLIALALFVLSVPAAWAQQHPNQKKGFDPTSVYHFDDIDSVNLFNGNLVITIPLGSSYKVNGGLSYGFTAVYNANIWDRYLDSSRLSLYPHRRGNAGLGWIVSLGRLLWVDDQTNTTSRPAFTHSFVYEAPDGSEVEFESDDLLSTQTYVTTTNRTTGGLDAPFRMSKDGPWIRKVELPDGRIQTFEWQNHNESRQRRQWRLTKIEDRLGNAILIDYSNNGLEWSVFDGHRTQHLYFQTVDASKSTYPQTVLDRIEETSFGGNQPAIYKFHYSTATVERPPNDQSSADRQQGPAIKIQVLSSIDLPHPPSTVGETYSMTYNTSGEPTGLISTLTFPTKGRVEYEWAPVYFSQASGRIGPLTKAEPLLGQLPIIGSPESPGGGPPAPQPDAPHAEAQTVLIGRIRTIGISKRTLYPTSGSASPQVWVYQHRLSSRPVCNVEGDVQLGDPRQKTTSVTAPNGTTTVSYFSEYREGTACEDDTGVWKSEEYGRPITHYQMVGDPTDPFGKKGLSQQVFVGEVTDAPTVTSPLWQPKNGTLVRSKWVSYDNLVQQRTEAAVRDTTDDDTGCGGPCYTEQYQFGWDGYAHFRQTSTTNNYPEADRKFRTTFTNYSGTGPNGEWVLNTFTEQCSHEDASWRKTAVSSCQDLLPTNTTATEGIRTQFCFNRSTGFLQRRRTYVKPAPTSADPNAPSANDVISVFLPDAKGNVDSELTYGGDRQAVGVSADLCSMGLPGAPFYGTQYGYDFGAVSRVTPIRYANHPDTEKRSETFDTVINTIDQSSGLVKASADASGVVTRFEYDLQGRLVKSGVATAVDGGYVGGYDQYTYNPATDSSNASVVVARIGGSDSTSETYVFDGLGRVTTETRSMPTRSASRLTTYDTAGRKETVSEFGEPAHFTRFVYDSLGRVVQQIAPDSSVIAFEYSGIRETRRKTKVQMTETRTGPQSESESWNIQKMDSLGRLAHVFGPTPSDPALTADYSYDVAGHLVGVRMFRHGDTLPIQTRTFTYDGRGFLLSEQHPESNKTSYLQYDARGHAGLKQQGDSGTSHYDLKMNYDASERLVSVGERIAAGNAESSFHALKTFTFGTANTPDAHVNKENRLKNKLQTAVRYNYDTGTPALGGDRAVTTTYSYADDEGRISSKTTAVQDGPTFKQDFTYNELGLPTHLRFPTCVGCGSADAKGDRALLLKYSKGYLQKVEGFVPAITYHDNGMIHELSHEITGREYPLKDVIELDEATKMPRPASITVNGLCTGPQISGIVTGPTEVFPEESFHLTAPDGGHHYEWFNATTGQPLNLLTKEIDTTITGATDFFVRVFGSDNCFTDSAVFHVGIRECSEISVPVLTVPEVVAPQGQATFTATVPLPPNTTLTYKWYLSTQDANGNWVKAPAIVTSASSLTQSLTQTTRVSVVVSSGTCVKGSGTQEVRVCEPPSIVKQPESQWAGEPESGQSVTLAASVVGKGEDLKYQWYERTPDGPVALTGETDDTLTRTYLHAEQHTFFVKVYDNSSLSACQGSEDSHDVVFSVTACARITMAPGNLQLYENSKPFVVPIEVSTGAPFTGTVSIRWYKGTSTTPVRQTLNVPIPASGPVRDELTIFSNQPSQTYWCVVNVDDKRTHEDPNTHQQVETNQCDVTLTTHKAMIVRYASCPLPEVSITPKAAILNLNGTQWFTVGCDWPSVTYQWYLGESGDTHRPIADATSNKFRATSTVQSYWCRVTDECGIKHRDTETVRVSRNGNPVCSPPFIASQPQSVNVAAGVQPTLFIDASNYSSLQWWEVGGGMVGTQPTFVAPSATKTYYVKLFTSCAAASDPMESASATVRVASCPSISVTTPASFDRNGGSPRLVVLGNAGSAPISYTWYQGQPGDVSHPVGTSATLPITIAATATYWVRMSTTDCTIDSAAVVATYCGAPTISQPPFGGGISFGDSFLLHAEAEGAGVTYKWHSGSQTGPVVGTTPGVWVSPTDTTTYVFEAIDACGVSVFSSPILVFVCKTPTFVSAPAVVGLNRIHNGKTGTISVRATETNSVPLEYQLCDVSHTPVGSRVPAPSNGGPVTLTTPAITANTQFTVRAIAGECFIDSDPIDVYLCSQEEVVGSQPLEKQVAVGESVHLIAGQNDFSDPNNVYAWYPGESGTTGTALKSSNDNWVTFSAPDPGDGDPVKKYWAQLVNLDGCTSRTETYVVRVCKPTITTPPASIMIDPNTSTTLSVTANAPGLTYQWYVGESGVLTNPVSGGTSASLIVSPTVDTSYWVKVTGTCGTPLNSPTATVTICKPPVLSSVGATGSSSIHRGETTSLGLSATGTNLTYQWYVGAKSVTTNPIAGATNSTLGGLTPQDTTSYWVRITGRCGSVDSDAVVITVCATPRIDTQPASTSIYSGGTATVTVGATALTAVPITYQWYHGNSGDTSSPISGATAASYTTPALTVPNNYWVRIKSGDCTAADSSTVTVDICPYQQSIAGPANVQTSVSQSTRLTTVPQTGSNVYRWYRADTNALVSGPLSTNYVDVAPSATRQYYATITTGSCMTTTTNTTVSVCVPTFTTPPPATKTVVSGVASFIDVAADTAGVTYQWYRGTGGSAVLLTGETGTRLNFTTSTNTTFWCRATGSCGRTTDSSVTTVTVCSPPTISGQPTNATPMYAGGSRTLSVAANGTDLTYQWYIGESGDTSQPIGGATSSSLTRSSVSQTAKFWVKVTGACGSVNSGAAWISIYPTITTDLQSMVVRSGSVAAYKVVATGSSLHYQWYYADGTSVSNNDTPYFTILSVTSANVPTGAYCDVSSGTATVRSTTSTVNLCDGVNIGIGISGSGSCRTLYATYDYASENYTWYKGNVGDISNPIGTGTSVQVCPTSTTKYWLRVSSTLQTGETCFSNSTAVTLP